MQIYRQSYFAIFAIAGESVEYGLPGVRWDSRKLIQVVKQVGNLQIANSLPFMEEQELIRAGKWGERAWCYQERFRAQRGLFIGERGMIINCIHSYGPEDENCLHVLPEEGEDHRIGHGQMVFYSGLNKSHVPDIRDADWTPFDSYAVMVSEYSQRKLSFRKDAERAFLSVLSYLSENLNCEMFYGMPDTEFDAALLWSPIGPSTRRLDEKTGRPLFPSWSWLGWDGHAAWPRQFERDSFSTTMNVCILWHNALEDAASRQDSKQYGSQQWFGPADLCLPDSPDRAAILYALSKKYADRLCLRMMCDRARTIHPDWLSRYRIDWPAGMTPKFRYNQPQSHRITLKAQCASFYVVGQPWQRKKPYNVDYPIWCLSIIDENARLVGYIDVPEPTPSSKIQLGNRFFAALSRSTIEGKVDPAPDNLNLHPSRRKEFSSYNTDLAHQGGMKAEDAIANYRHHTAADKINKAGNFDTEVYPVDRPWCMYNVMMLKTLEGRNSQSGGALYEREAIGRIHVDAFEHFAEKSAHSSVKLMRTVELV
jgi:hypothetical protein